MLQANQTQRAAGREFAQNELEPSADVLQPLIKFLRRQFPVIVVSLLLALVLGGVYLISTPQSFTARAMLIIDSRKLQLFQQQSVLGDIPVDSASLESQIEILKSENVALSVIKNLELSHDPEFVGSSGGLAGALIGFVTSSLGEPSSEFEMTRRAVRTFQDRLNIKRIGLSYVIEISFRSLDPERAAQIANAVGDAYIVDQLEAKYQATRRASSWLQERIKELRDQTSTAERAVNLFKNTHNIVEAGGKLMDQQQIAELNSQLIVARGQISDTRARLERIDAVLRAESPATTVNSTVTDTLTNPVITKLRSQYLELSNREADWSAKYGRNHLAAVNLRNQMREIQISIKDELRRTAEGYRSDYEIAKQREENIQKELAQAVSESRVTSQALVQLRELESAAQTSRTLYDNFLQRYMESVQQQSFPITDARLISQATRPLQKSNPQTLLVLAIAGLGGGILGLGLAMFRDMTDRVFRTSAQIEHDLSIDCIATVPSVDAEMGAQEAWPSVALGRSEPRTIVRQKNVCWSPVDLPFSRFAEAIRSMKLTLDLSAGTGSNKVVGFTSALPDEGKSTLAVALALSIAQAKARVLLVDGDLRNPSISRILAPDAMVGFLHVLTGKVSLQDAVWKDPSTGMTFLPAGVGSRLALSSDILASQNTKKLFESLASSYDYVVVDLSPLTPLVDARVTANFVDSYFLVVRWGHTKIDTVRHALGAAQEIYQNLLGAVLNRANIKIMSRYDGQYGSYFNKYNARYGHTE